MFSKWGGYALIYFPLLSKENVEFVPSLFVVFFFVCVCFLFVCLVFFIVKGFRTMHFRERRDKTFLPFPGTARVNHVAALGGGVGSGPAPERPRSGCATSW